MSAGTDPCRVRLDQLLHRELAGWEGLPEGCTERDVARRLPLHPGKGVVRLGSERVEYRFRAVEAVGFTEPVRLHFRDGTLRVVRTGLWSTDRADTEQLVRQLGDPPDRLPLVFGMGTIPDATWIYPAQGLAIGLIPDTGLIPSVAAYPPCSADAYRRCLHDYEPVREFPGSP